MQITYFPTIFTAKGAKQEVEPEAFLSKAKIGVDKRALPVFTFAIFDDDYRDIKHFREAYMLGFDVDIAPIPDESKLRAEISRLGCMAYYHSSSSATADSPRWRLFIPLSRPVVTENEYRSLHGLVRERLSFQVGQQAKDPSRGWFIPAQGIGGHFVYGRVDGDIFDVDKAIKSITTVSRKPAPSVPFTGSINLPPSEEIHEALVKHLVAHWPLVGNRDECHMSLAGTLAKLGYPADYVARVIAEVSDATGSDKGQTRASMVRRTFEKLQEGSPVNGWTRLTELIGLVNAEQIHDILALRLPKPRADRSGDLELPDHDASHTYSYSVGDAPSADLRAATMSDLVATLTDHPDWVKVLRWNTISDTIVAVNPPCKLEAEHEKFSRSDITMIQMWLENHGIKAKFESVEQAVETAAKQIKWNPIVNYLQKVGKADKPGTIKALCEKAMGVTDELSQTMVRKQLIAAVRRAFGSPLGLWNASERHVKVDSVLVFRSPQAKNKTQFIELLFGSRYVKTNLADIKSKDAVQELKGIWAVEFGELASIANSDVESLKEFLSRSIDKYRPSYGKTRIDVPRSCVFFGTTNATAFLKDETGNRRFWIIELNQEINLDWVRKHRDDIWAEAYNAALAGEEHWLKGEYVQGAEDRAQEFYAIDAWAQLVHDYCVGKDTVRTEDIYQMAICGGDPGAPRSLDDRAQKRIAKILTFYGAKSGTIRIKGRPVRAWRLPDSFRDDVRITTGAATPSANGAQPTANGHNKGSESSADTTGPVVPSGRLPSILKKYN